VDEHHAHGVVLAVVVEDVDGKFRFHTGIRLTGHDG
jgi:hypothetical protein